MKVLHQAVLPRGFMANAVPCGIKKSGKMDLALFYSSLPAKAAAVFTANQIQAAPIQVSKKHLASGCFFQGLVVNSGNANCFTGSAGLKDAQGVAAQAAKSLRVKKENILVASTGIIARKLPLAKIKQAMPGLVAGLSGGGIAKAKKAILTTDTFAKEITVKFNLGVKVITICGVAKGSGMIAPNLVYPEPVPSKVLSLSKDASKGRSRGASPERPVVSAVEPSRRATMLVLIFTDANISQQALRKALKINVVDSFNCITVDGCMSTNDMVSLMANGAAGNRLIDSGKNFQLFTAALNRVCLELAKMIVRDGEGATKFITIKVHQARSCLEARQVALSVANSNLFKTAMFASSKNVLGRIVASVGASGVEIKEKGLKIVFSPLKKKQVEVNISLKRGKASAVVYTSDLSYGYVKINAEYN